MKNGRKREERIYKYGRDNSAAVNTYMHSHTVFFSNASAVSGDGT